MAEKDNLGRAAELAKKRADAKPAHERAGPTETTPSTEKAKPAAKPVPEKKPATGNVGTNAERVAAEPPVLDVARASMCEAHGIRACGDCSKNPDALWVGTPEGKEFRRSRPARIHECPGCSVKLDLDVKFWGDGKHAHVPMSFLCRVDGRTYYVPEDLLEDYRR